MPPVTTPALPQTPAATSPRRNVVDVHASFDASAVDVCTAGHMTALHFATRKGRVVVRLPLDELLTKVRGDRDSNGRPFPVLTRAQQLAADASTAAAQPMRDVPCAPRPRRTAEQIEASHQAVWVALRAGSREPITVLAAIHGGNTDQLYAWLKANHAREWELLQRYRKGTASQGELAELGFPLTKPSAESL